MQMELCPTKWYVKLEYQTTPAIITYGKWKDTGITLTVVLTSRFNYCHAKTETNFSQRR